MYRYELHSHQNVTSRCAVWSPEELVEHYAKWGYAGVVISDHFFNGNCCVPMDLPWKEKVDRFCLGYERAKAAGEKVGLDVFFAFEYSVNTLYGADGKPQSMHENVRQKDTMGGCDFLVYGLDKEWLLRKNEEMLALPVNEFMKMAKEEGGTIVQAHPFRLEKSYMDHISLFPDYTDGVEVLNGNPNTVGRANRLAEAYAKEYGFFKTAGTDAHKPCKLLSVVELKKRAKTMEELLQALKAGKAKLSLQDNPYIE